MKDKLIEQQGFVEQDTALESMRASDFDCYSAYGEVIDNSIQAFANDIRIRFEEDKDRSKSPRKKISKVYFADNGIGMDEAYQDKVFLPFQRINRNEIKGTGIGLAICKKVILMHKGKISYSSIPEEGTTFYFTIHQDN